MRIVAISPPWEDCDNRTNIRRWLGTILAVERMSQPNHTDTPKDLTPRMSLT